MCWMCLLNVKCSSTYTPRNFADFACEIVAPSNWIWGMFDVLMFERLFDTWRTADLVAFATILWSLHHVATWSTACCNPDTVCEVNVRSFAYLMIWQSTSKLSMYNNQNNEEPKLSCVDYFFKICSIFTNFTKRFFLSNNTKNS